jgi:hypothetical protein
LIFLGSPAGIISQLEELYTTAILIDSPLVNTPDLGYIDNCSEFCSIEKWASVFPSLVRSKVSLNNISFASS